MRISTEQRFDRGSQAMRTLSAQADTIQAQISSGKKLAAPSDDAAAYRQLTTIKRSATDDSRNAANVSLASGLLDAADTTLSGVESQLQSANELALQGANGTLTTDQRKVIATQLDSIIADLVRLANTTDSRGAALFSGANDTLAYKLNPDNSVTYLGTGESSPIPIGQGGSVQATDSGARTFAVTTAAGATDIFAVLKSAADNLRAGGDGGTAVADIKSSLNAVGDARASVGARGARLELEAARLDETKMARESKRSALEDTDPYEAYAAMQKTLSVLSATQASFTKLTQLSLFDYLK
ncbi:flagellar hook-associated protein FlgL [Sphingomonas sp. RS2018]